MHVLHLSILSEHIAQYLSDVLTLLIATTLGPVSSVTLGMSTLPTSPSSAEWNRTLLNPVCLDIYTEGTQSLSDGYEHSP